MHDWLLDLLRCPRHGGALRLDDIKRDGPAILGRRLVCPQGCAVPIVDGIPDFVGGDEYVESFSAQRRLLKRVFPGYVGAYSGDDLAALSRIPWEDYRQGITLDAGCGYGRYCNAIVKAGGRVVGADLSMTSLRLIREQLGDHPNLGLVHGNLYTLPFSEGAFDRVISIGVLHHTPSTRDGFLRVSRHARVGGHCTIYVYDRYSMMRKMIDVHRKWTLRIPQGLLVYLLAANQLAFTWIRRIPKLGRLVQACFPCDQGGRPWRERITGDFDAYSPAYGFSHSYGEVYDWFTQAGFGDIRLGSIEIWITGTRVRPPPPIPV